MSGCCFLLLLWFCCGCCCCCCCCCLLGVVTAVVVVAVAMVAVVVVMAGLPTKCYARSGSVDYSSREPSRFPEELAAKINKKWLCTRRPTTSPSSSSLDGDFQGGGARVSFSRAIRAPARQYCKARKCTPHHIGSVKGTAHRLPPFCAAVALWIVLRVGGRPSQMRWFGS